MRRAYHRLLPTYIRSSLRLAAAVDERDRGPRVITRFDEASVVVVAPHMDDEVAGAGGTIRLHVDAGARVTVVFTTDGSQGCNHLRGADPSFPTDRAGCARHCIEIREAESRAACAALGVEDLVFLGGPDGALRPTDALVDALSSILKDRRPRIVYHPSLLDLHEDHWQTNNLLARCLEADILGASARLRGYEVWTPLIANAQVDISDVMPMKLSAFAHFKTQNSAANFPRAFEGLNAYRSLHHAFGVGYAEAFHETSVQKFLALHKRAMVLPSELGT